MTHEEVLNFWFEETTPSQWWVKDHHFDEVITTRFQALHGAAARCELSHWRKTAKGRLAEIIILDQFSRNMFRDTPQAFAVDSMALALAQEAIYIKADEELSAIEKCFLYMPFMHSESLAIHQQAVVLFTQNGIESNVKFELQHKEIIEKFGRYPHRNAILQRTSTPQELAFLTQPNSSF